MAIFFAMSLHWQKLSLCVYATGVEQVLSGVATGREQWLVGRR
jgi:hypothetical protein